MVDAWLLSHLLPQNCSDGKQTMSVLSGGVCKLDPDCLSEVRR